MRLQIKAAMEIPLNNKMLVILRIVQASLKFGKTMS
jgi:hypothetical protein